jgi:hypothetical protein
MLNGINTSAEKQLYPGDSDETDYFIAGCRISFNRMSDR